MTESTNFNSGDNIHVKLQFNSEYRRFFIQKSCKFSDLYEKIKIILGLKDSNFIIKYKDEEGEWITISTDMELDTGLILCNGTVLRIQISLTGSEVEKPTIEGEKTNEIEKECEVKGKDCDKPWRNKGKWRKWNDREEENGDDYRPRYRGRGSYRGGRGKWRKYRDDRNDEENNEEEGRNDENVTGEERNNHEDWDKKKWKKFKRERKIAKRMEDEETSSDTNSGDALLGLEEIKKNLEKLKQDMVLLKEKCRGAKAELKDLKFKLKQKRRNESTDIDGLVELRNSLKEKKQSTFTIIKEMKSTRSRIRKLHELAETKKV